LSRDSCDEGLFHVLVTNGVKARVHNKAKNGMKRIMAFL